MLNLARLIGTGVIWGMSAIILSIAVSRQSGFDVIALTTVVMLAATASTRFLWQNDLSSMIGNAAEKSKRTGSRRVRALMEVLNDEELDELRARLQASESDEVMPLETLLARERQPRS